MKTAFILRYLISYLLISPLFPMVFRVGGVGFTPILHHFAFSVKATGNSLLYGQGNKHNSTCYIIQYEFRIFNRPLGNKK